ncbi:DinB family protein [Flavobacteriaceae bacterium F89]|uniref:DinB family protein n=1 Tax=Cerina litoralis TaxID=2874477 RepID=A0AAE3EV55_9FLAO|nr:DinB family protein [Cerina litoralis]MCG2460879.1 DinB family protein [Cerina litoralis]
MKISFLIFIGFLSMRITAQNRVIPTFLEKWENSKNYLIAVASAMPEEKYDFRPTKREMSFGEQLLHIRENMLMLATTYFTDNPLQKENMAVAQNDKTHIILFLAEAFDQTSAIVKAIKPNDLSQEVDFFAGTKTKLQILNLMQDHVTHHRGQLIVYLNLNGIEPPKYIGW